MSDDSFCNALGHAWVQTGEYEVDDVPQHYSSNMDSVPRGCLTYIEFTCRGCGTVTSEQELYSWRSGKLRDAKAAKAHYAKVLSDTPAARKARLHELGRMEMARLQVEALIACASSRSRGKPA